MKKISALFVIPLMLLGALLVPSTFATSGTVSVNGGSIVNPSPLNAPTVSVPIQIANSGSFNSFDIQVFSNTAYLEATGVSLTGSVLSSSPVIVLECINGVLVSGTTCSSNDGVGVVHLSVTQNSGTSAPTNGLLFTINYNVVGQTTGSPISFLAGCGSTTSVSNGDCVTVDLGGVPVSQTDQGATFANLVDFSMTPQFAALSTPSGVPIHDVINYASEGGYADFLTETCSATAGLTCSFASGSPGMADLFDSTTASDTLTVSGTVSGSVSVNATGQGVCSPFPACLRSHVITIPVQIASPGFGISLSQSSVTISRGNSDSTTTVNVNGFGGFSGTISFTSSATNSGITASASPATLTNGGSGLSSASSMLTISVGSSVPTGNYTLTVTGTSGSSHSATMTVQVPGQDFSITATPNSETIIRGGTLAVDVTLTSIGNFAGTFSFSTAITPVQGQQDSCCLTNNITPGYNPANPSLSAGGSVVSGFSAGTVGGLAPTGPNYTATGNYIANITATSGSVSHSVIVNFTIEDFSLGPGYCAGTTNNFVTGPGSLYTPIEGPFPQGFFNVNPDGSMTTGTTIGGQCSNLTITSQPNVLTPLFGIGNQVLWVQDNSLGGLVTSSFPNGFPSVSALNPQMPFAGVTVPALAPVLGAGLNRMCLAQTFWANGTQIPYSYLAANGPLITESLGYYPALAPGVSFWGCRFDVATYPNDDGASAYSVFGLNFTNFNNPDLIGVTAMAISGTLPGTYTFNVCAQAGVIHHCTPYTLTVVSAPFVHQLVVKSSYSFSATHGLIPFKLGISNPDATHTIYAQVTATGIGSLGDMISASSGVVKIAPGASANNIALSVPVIASEVGETFTFTFVINVGTDPVNLQSTSTLSTVTKTFTLTA